MNRAATLLGLAGLIPFVGLTAMMYQPWAIGLFMTYSAVILSFLGGIHWGVALRDTDWRNNWRLCLCMLPSLLAWLALALPVEVALTLLLLSYAAWWLYDFMQLAIADYRRLRRCLTLVVLACHGSWLYFYV